MMTLDFQLDADGLVRSSALLACVECGQLPEVAEEELSEGMEATIQCPHGCNTVVGPTRWAVMEWNRQMGKQDNEKDHS
jgi:hypothetical protein